MFIFNFNLKSKKIFKKILIFSLIIALSLFIIACYNIINELFENDNHDGFEMPTQNIAKISPENYTNILKEVHENIDTYIGQKISFTGYVYRVSDLKSNQFILARDMQIDNTNQTVVVGFLTEYDDAENLSDNTWITVTGEIKKGYYYCDIPVIQVTSIENAEIPENPIVPMPDEFYIPTSIIF